MVLAVALFFMYTGKLVCGSRLNHGTQFIFTCNGCHKEGQFMSVTSLQSIREQTATSLTFLIMERSE